RTLIDEGVNTFVEVGPGKVLTGLLRQIERSVAALNVEDEKSLGTTLDRIAAAKSDAPWSCSRLGRLIRRIGPQCFSSGILGTLAYYERKLGFKCISTWQDSPVYAIVARDEQAIHFRCAEPPKASPDKYADELLDAYISIEDADALYAEYAARGVEFTREL